LDQAAFRPWYANTVDPDPDRTAEVDYQHRLLKAGDYHLQLEMQQNDLAERNKTLVKEIATNTDTINQLEWQLHQALQDGEAEHFNSVGLQEDLIDSRSNLESTERRLRHRLPYNRS
jgi:hypothetical protein